jgi:hypothetical protein
MSHHFGKQLYSLFFKIKLNKSLSYDPLILLLGKYLREVKVHIQKKTCMRRITAAILGIARKLEATQMSINRPIG